MFGCFSPEKKRLLLAFSARMNWTKCKTFVRRSREENLHNSQGGFPWKETGINCRNVFRKAGKLELGVNDADMDSHSAQTKTQTLYAFSYCQFFPVNVTLLLLCWSCKLLLLLKLKKRKKKKREEKCTFRDYSSTKRGILISKFRIHLWKNNTDARF